MQVLNICEAEAKEVIEYDKAVDRMPDKEVANDLTPEQKKIVKKMASTGTRQTPKTYQFTKRERKPNATKEGLITELAAFLAEHSEFAIENCEIVNPNREISFNIGENSYSLVLSKHRNKAK